MKKYLIVLLLLLLLPISTYAKASSEIVMDIDSGRILYSNNIHEKRLIASITKIMTCIIVLENKNLKEKMIVGNEIDGIYGTNIYLEHGEVLTTEDLLYGLMLRSGNELAMTE